MVVPTASPCPIWVWGKLFYCRHFAKSDVLKNKPEPLRNPEDRIYFLRNRLGAISSVVERHIDIVKAGGPIPPSRTGALVFRTVLLFRRSDEINEKYARVAQW